MDDSNTTTTIDAEQAGSSFGWGLTTRGDFDSGGEVAIGVLTCVNDTVITGAASEYEFTSLKGLGLA